LTRTAVDLADAAARAAFLDEALAGAGKALVLTEGLLMYLEKAMSSRCQRRSRDPKSLGGCSISRARA
jgi:O-methyltransferase involved in polyketide biosynthesis